MPTIWENSHINILSTLHGKKTKVQESAGAVRVAVEPLIGPDAAKILVAIAADIWAGVEQRNDLGVVRDASSALKKALQSLEDVTLPLDG